jgi:MscS family membrane protein
MIRKIQRLVLLIVAALVIAQAVFRQDVGAWLAGLGIAGLAVSLASQDSLKNFFGAMTIFFDRTYAIGDYVVVGDIAGSVEDIGFRSTRLRGDDGRLMTVPNLNMVGQTVQNVSRRNFLFRKLDVTITCDTPLKNIEQAVQIIRDILAEPGIAEPINRRAADGNPRPPRVYFEKLNSDNLSIGVWYWFVPADWWAFMEHTQKVNLRLMQEFEKAGIEFAFPTQMLYHADDPKRQLTLSIDPDVKSELVAALTSLPKNNGDSAAS